MLYGKPDNYSTDFCSDGGKYQPAGTRENFLIPTKKMKRLLI